MTNNNLIFLKLNVSNIVALPHPESTPLSPPLLLFFDPFLGNLKIANRIVIIALISWFHKNGGFNFEMKLMLI